VKKPLFLGGFIFETLADAAWKWGGFRCRFGKTGTKAASVWTLAGLSAGKSAEVNQLRVMHYF